MHVKVYLSEDECCVVYAGDTLGLLNADAVASQFYVGDLSVRVSSSDAQNVNITDQLVFDSLVFPYRVLLAAAYDTGLLYPGFTQCRMAMVSA